MSGNGRGQTRPKRTRKSYAGRKWPRVSEFVDDQEADLGELGLKAEQSLLVARLDQLVDQLGGGGEADAEALLAGGEAECERGMSLADA